MINIIRGSKKKTKLEVPSNNVRPTSAKKRESIFSILESNGIKNNLDIYTNKYYLDLFAGCGSLGLEAISRGAKFCYFYEIEKEVIKTLRKNCLKISKSQNFKIIQEDLTKSLFEEINNSISIVFMDPPYKFINFKIILKNLIKKELLLKNSIIVIESKKNTIINFPSLMKIIDEKYYGITKITFLSFITK